MTTAHLRSLLTGGDRRSIEFPVVLSQIRSVLPSLTLKDEDNYKLEIAPNLLPKEGVAVKLIIEAK